MQNCDINNSKGDAKGENRQEWTLEFFCSDRTSKVYLICMFLSYVENDITHAYIGKMF